MGNIIDILTELVSYYHITRGAGHTTVMLDGTKMHPRSIIIVVDGNHKRNLGMDIENKTIGLDGLSSLRGIREPLAFCHYTLMEIFSRSLHEIGRYQRGFEQMKADLFRERAYNAENTAILNGVISGLRAEIENMKLKEKNEPWLSKLIRHTGGHRG